MRNTDIYCTIQEGMFKCDHCKHPVREAYVWVSTTYSHKAGKQSKVIRVLCDTCAHSINVAHCEVCGAFLDLEEHTGSDYVVCKDCL